MVGEGAGNKVADARRGRVEKLVNLNWKLTGQFRKVATLDDGDLIVWTGHLVFLLSDFRYKKSRRPFSDFLLGVPLGAAGI